MEQKIEFLEDCGFDDSSDDFFISRSVLIDIFTRRGFIMVNKA